jgi:hypothetical protein
VGLCQGRSAVRWPGPARSAVLLLAQPRRRAPEPASRRLCRAGVGDLYDARRKPGPITQAARWSNSRRKFFKSPPLALEPARNPSRCRLTTRPSRPSPDAYADPRQLSRHKTITVAARASGATEGAEPGPTQSGSSGGLGGQSPPSPTRIPTNKAPLPWRPRHGRSV